MIRQTMPMMNMTTSEIWVPFITREKLSRPISSCPHGWSPSEKKFENDQVGAPPGLTTGPEAVWLNFHQPGMPAKPCALKAKIATSTRTTMEIIAPL